MKHSDTAHETLVLKYLQSGKTLTHKQAERRFGCGRLAARVNRLKFQDGYDIRKKMIRINPRTTVAEYYLYLESV